MLKKLLPLVLAATFSLTVLADEASVKKAVEAKLGTKVSSVLKSPYLGLYEVYADGQILYTDEKLTAIIAGTLIDGKTMKNVTAERMQKLTAIKFSDLPLELAVKQVRGDGRRVLATFEDPNCGYCKKLAKDIAKLDNITLYTFLYPILSPDSLDKSNQVWCSADRRAALTSAKLGTPLKAAVCKPNPVAEQYALGQSIGLSGTPGIITEKGELLPGYEPPDEMLQELQQEAQAGKG